MNFINGTTTPDGFKTTDGILLPTVKGAADRDHLRHPSGAPAPRSDDGIEIEVVVLEPTGSETQVIGRLGTQPITGIFRERINVAPGSTIKVKPDLSVVHLFDSNGQRVN